MGSQRIDMSFEVCGRLVVIDYAYTKGKRAFWRCICECGKTCIVHGKDLRLGHTKSCGCLGNEKRMEKVRTHGLSKTRLHRIWCGMKGRTSNKNHFRYEYYGGRGISVCSEWRDSFEIFREWALVNGYKENLTIERIDVNGNYQPDNCTWITIEEQQRNKRKKHDIR